MSFDGIRSPAIPLFLSRGAATEQKSTSAWNIIPGIVVLGLIVAPAWLFGGYEASVQQWLALAALVALAFSLYELVQTRAAAGLPAAVIVLLGALLLGAFQLLPLPRSMRTWLSPAGTELTDKLQLDLSQYSKTLPEVSALHQERSLRPLSLYPASTRRDLALLVLAAACFLLGVWAAGAKYRLLWVCSAIALNGACFALFGIAQKLSWNGQLYWSYPIEHGSPFAAFVNRNHAGAFLNLCLAGAIGAAVWTMQRTRRMAASNPWRVVPHRSWATSVLDLSTRIDVLPVLAAFVLTVTIAAGIFCSLSRGAIASMLTAGIACVIASGRHRTRSLMALMLLGVGSLALVFYVGMDDDLRRRISAAIGDPDSAIEGRLLHWVDGLRGAADYSIIGSGLGTYRYVYAQYQERSDEGWYFHAENHYLEAMFEGGIPAIALLLSLICLIGYSIWGLLRDPSDSVSYALGMGGLFGLTSQVVHAHVDFALYAPANCILLAILCGTVSGRASHLSAIRSTASDGSVLRRILFRGPRIAVAPATAVLLLATMWSCGELRAVAAVELPLRVAESRSSAEQQNPEMQERLLSELQAALLGRPDDAEGHDALANLWIDFYQSQALRELRKNYPDEISDQHLQKLTSLNLLHARVHQLRNAGDFATLERLRQEPLVRNYLGAAIRHLALSAEACPLSPEVHLDLVRLCVFDAEDYDLSAKTDAIVALRPSDADVLYASGLLHYHKGDVAASCQLWQQSLSHSSEHIDDIMRLVKGDLSATQMVEMLLPKDPQLLLDIATKYFSDETSGSKGRVFAQAAVSLLERPTRPEDQSFWLRGLAYRLQGMYPEAIKNYSRAVELSPANIQWRYELALLEWRHGEPTAAHDHARQCVRMDPNRAEYLTLLKAINRERLRGANANL